MSVMHPWLRWPLLAFVAVFAGGQFVRPSMTNPPVEPGASLTATAPREVSAILQRSCRDCHSNETTWPWYSQIAPFSWMLASHVNDGRDHFNYSEWTSITADDQDKFLGAICSMTRRGRMPLPSYLLIHRGSTLTPADVATLCRWSDRMRDTLK